MCEERFLVVCYSPGLLICGLWMKLEHPLFLLWSKTSDMRIHAVLRSSAHFMREDDRFATRESWSVRVMAWWCNAMILGLGGVGVRIDLFVVPVRSTESR